MEPTQFVRSSSGLAVGCRVASRALLDGSLEVFNQLWSLLIILAAEKCRNEGTVGWTPSLPWVASTQVLAPEHPCSCILSLLLTSPSPSPVPVQVKVFFSSPRMQPAEPWALKGNGRRACPQLSAWCPGTPAGAGDILLNTSTLLSAKWDHFAHGFGKNAQTPRDYLLIKFQVKLP